MPPERKEICSCGVLETASKEPGHVVRWDEQMNEYYLAHGKSGRMMVYYCPFCGGSTPKSRRESLFAHVSQQEESRILGLFREVRTVADVLARFGQPDEEREFASGVRHPGKDGKAESGEMYRGLVYRNLSPVAEIIFEVGRNESVHGRWIQKYVGKTGQ